MKTLAEKKEFALTQIAPYFKDPSTCGYDAAYQICCYVNKMGKMCVAGKCMINPQENEGQGSINSILTRKTQSEVFKPEFVGILSQSEWSDLQQIHDSIAKRDGYETQRYIKNMNLFTYGELIEYAGKL